MNHMFEIWSPDEVAECLPGVCDDDYARLWLLVPGLPKNTSEVPDSFADRALARVWDRLPSETQSRLNALADRHFPEVD